MIRKFLFLFFFFLGISIISIIFLPSLIMPNKVVLFGGKIMGRWAALCLQIILQTKIIVRGKEKDLDVVDKLIKEIDVRTKQVLIEAFIVEANSDFERALGTRLGGYYLRGGKNVGGIAGPSSGSADGTDLSADGVGELGSAADSITNFAATGASSGIGILRRTGTGVL